jgi:hypothetical protein
MAEGGEVIGDVLENADGLEIDGGEIAGIARIDLEIDPAVDGSGMNTRNVKVRPLTSRFWMITKGLGPPQPVSIPISPRKPVAV